MFRLLPISVRRTIRLRAWRRLNLRWTLASGIIIEITCPADWEIYNEIFVEGEYDSAVVQALKMAGPKPLTVLDLGCNFGFFCFRVLHLANVLGVSLHDAEFTMVDGSQRVLDELRQRESYQVLTKHNANIIHGLLGSRTGSAMIYESDFHAYNSIIDRRGTGSVAPFVDLEQRFADCNRIDLMKCDIQGAEQQFLGNHPLLLRKTSIAVLELHHFLCNTTQCIRILTESGFSKITTLRHNEAVSVVQCER